MTAFERGDELFGEVSEDLEQGFDGILEPTGVLELLEPFDRGVVASDDVAVFGWAWPVRHVGHLDHMPPTQREVTVYGVTVVDIAKGQLQFTRFIDWFSLYSELGGITMARPDVIARAPTPAGGDDVT